MRVPIMASVPVLIPSLFGANTDFPVGSYNYSRSTVVETTHVIALSSTQRGIIIR